ncbi:sigma-54-dependent Fis family transcriptional regulator [candidate division KSB1 bacterium]|nr:MAG: sigma-54-dependent Fis family transcriptional regulator [candidate division KSB1 bacterium]
MPGTILVVDDDPDLRQVVRLDLEERGYEIIEAGDGEEGHAQFTSLLPDLSIIDVGLPGAYDGVELLRRIHDIQARHPVLIISGQASPEKAVEAMKQGAFDYLGKPLNLEKLALLIERGLASVRKDNELERVSKTQKATYGFERIIGSCSSMQEVINTARKVATVPFATVLLTGESGTGKELVAHAIHLASANAKEPFVEVNCAAMPETLLEAELFGYEKGAFTDAKQRKRGLFEVASAGTFFLDEIGEMSPNLQVKLLKVIEERSFRRLGGTSPLSVQFRLIAATNADLHERMAAGAFRRDLYYRLNVFTIHLPPLRERGSDVIHVAEHFIRHFNREFSKSMHTISPDAQQLLMSYDWPGNIRELRNAIERAVLIGASDEIRPQDLAIKARLKPLAAPEAAPTAETALPGEILDIKIPAHGVNFEEVERQLIRLAMRHCHNNASAAARFLRMTRETLRYRLKKFGIREGVEQE